jgi:hypothetical protein
MRSFKFRAEAGEMFRGMVMADMAKIMGTVDLMMAIISTVTASHPRVVNSIVVIKGLLRRSTRISGGRCM